MFLSRKSQLMSIDREMDRIMDRMAVLDPTQEDYVVLGRRYEALLNLRTKLEGKDRKIFIQKEFVLETAKVMRTATGTIIVPIVLAKIAYTNDRELNLCNGRVWNIVGKNYSSKA